MTHNGETKSLVEWAQQYEMPYTTLHSRLQRGWSLADALKGRRHYAGEDVFADLPAILVKQLRKPTQSNPPTSPSHGAVDNEES